MKPVCFVVQPFDGSVYDIRYRDTYKPAIAAAGYDPYRVDHDISVTIPIEQIEKGIMDADCVFADISEDNPNVWLEVGLAIAHRQEMCLICSEKRPKFPFDVQHRSIIRYNSTTRSDFEFLQSKITKKLISIRESNVRIKQIRTSIVNEQVNLRIEDLNLLAAVAGNIHGQIDRWDLFAKMNKWGFTDLATGLALRSLDARQFIKIGTDENHNGEEIDIVRILDSGWKYIESNIEKFKTTNEKRNPAKMDDDIPF
jgi:hypothetical protein